MKNTLEQTPESGVQIIQATPGRIRVQVPQLTDDAELVRQLEQFALQTGGITSILINRAAASLVITYKSDSDTSAKIQACLEDLKARDRQTASSVELPSAQEKPHPQSLEDRQASEAQLQQQLEDLQQSLAAQTEQYEALQQQYQQQTEQITTLEQFLAAQAKKYETLQQQYQQQTEQITTLEQSLAAQTEKYEALQQKYQQQTEQASSLQQQLLEQQPSPTVEDGSNSEQPSEEQVDWRSVAKIGEWQLIKWRRRTFT